MLSDAKLQANRANAARSTGPRTPEGKANSARNSVRHGLLAEHLLLPDEDAAEMDQFRAALLSELEPVGEVEHVLAERVVTTSWRLRRAHRIEAALLQAHRFDGAQDKGLGVSLMRDAHHGDVFPKVGRYEAMLDRGLMRALHELERRQAKRRGEHVPVPGVVDVNVLVDDPADGLAIAEKD